MRILKASDIYKNHSSFLLNKVKRGTLHHSFLMKVVFETVTGKTQSYWTGGTVRYITLVL